VRSECCITELKDAVQHSVCEERYFRTGSTSQDMHRFLPNVVAVNDDLKIIY
jgi:hypothetical protein